MGLDIYFREDLANILVSAEAASQATAWAAGMEGKRLRAYREGYRAALMVVAQALGLTELPVLPVPTMVEDPVPGRREALTLQSLAWERGAGR